MKSITEFYDSLAQNYDLMTNPGARFSKEQENFKEIIKKYSIRSALDAGCGTGFHSLLLASLGVKVTAVDISNEMLLQLQKNAKETNLSITTIQSGFEQLETVLPEKFDAVCCLGNTLAHIPTKELPKTLNTLNHMLKEKGVILFQFLNYDLILQTRERIVNITEKENKTFIRFYDFLETTIGFNILTIERTQTGITHTLQTTEVYPVFYHEIVEILHSMGLMDVQRYGSLSLTPFHEETSRDVILCVHNNE